VVTLALLGRRIMAEANITYIQAVIGACRLAMCGIERLLQSAFDWRLFPV